ncbi:MAG TPA: hypothetical protein VKR31_16355 [Rhizomicrobium sp.]|nr:hypothetical protein [Rhizomicrobium sp.]
MQSLPLTTGASALALVVAFAATAVPAHAIYYPHPRGVAPRIDPDKPLGHVGRHEAPFVAKRPTTSGTWADVAATLPFKHGPWAPQQLTDGTVLIQDYCTTHWYKLVPDNKGNYANGTWSAINPMPNGYQPLFFATQILPSGQMIVNGGEYNGDGAGRCEEGWYNLGAIYDPVADKWTAVAPPAGWAMIGDAESVILPNGSYMLANCCDYPAQQAIASVGADDVVTWTTGSSYACATGDFCNDEQGYAALPNGNVFMVDVWDYGANYDDYEIYDTATGVWSLAGQTADRMSDSTYFELGAAPLTPQYGSQGTIIQFSGAAAAGTTPVSDIYDVASGTWKSGPALSYKGVYYTEADAPAATLPDGNVLMSASPGYGNAPTHFWEWKFTAKGKVTTTQVNDPAQAPNTSDFEGNLLVLPTGQVLWDNSQTTPNEVAIYTPVGSAKVAWKPVIGSVASSLVVGSTGNPISGTNFNGFDLGGVYGDDAQAATNFPLVRITNGATGDVCFARSYNFSTMGVWTSGTTNAVFDIPATCETGKSKLQVIVNGIASVGARVMLHS